MATEWPNSWPEELCSPDMIYKVDSAFGPLAWQDVSKERSILIGIFGPVRQAMIKHFVGFVHYPAANDEQKGSPAPI